jgi:hypothetical protein
MTDANLYRAAGVAGLAAGALNILVEFLPDRVGQPLNLMVNILGLWLLTALYLRQRQAAGRFGFAAYVVNSFGLALAVGLIFSQAFVLSALDPAVLAPLFQGAAGVAIITTLAVLTLGAVLFGIVMLRTGVFPRWAALLYIVGFVWLGAIPILSELLVTLGEIVVSLALFGLSRPLLAAGQGAAPGASAAEQ